MATKQTLSCYIEGGKKKTDLPGYAINPQVGLVQHPTQKHWLGVHIPTGLRLDRDGKYRFKQKRECLAFLESLIEQGMDFDVATHIEWVEKNPDFEAMFSRAVLAARG